MEKINIITLEDTQEELNESEKKVMKLSETNWKDYLEEMNYNKDPEKMCEICIKEQYEKHGGIVIPCTGLNTAANKAGDAIFKTLVDSLTPEELAELDALYDPYTYMETFLDLGVKGKSNSIESRWYQQIISKCSAQGKVIRLGRRSGKTYMMALMMVHEMLMTDNYRVLVVSPYAVQTSEVVKTFIDLCTRLPDNPIKSKKQTPVWEINFHNGSILMGFTAATNADSVRGQTAHRIVLDECLVGDTKITMADGSEKEIKNVVIGDYVYSNEGSIDRVINSRSTGIKNTYEYTFDNGSILKGTDNHPVLALDGFVPISEASSVQVPEKNR